MKKIYFLLVSLFFTFSLHAQNSGRFTLKGKMADTLGVGLQDATVMLLQPKDSSLVNFGRTSKDGSFEFRGLKRGPYIFKATYVGYVPFQKHITPDEGDVTDIGKQDMSYLNQQLYDVVIKTARAPLSIHGDTVEYDPRAFKVPPGATVEDLLRRLPGMQVDQDGSLRSQGEAIKRVTVDGKRFFGDDTRAATKNLPADAISKVQVFNEKTEQSRITGVDDGKHDKTLNLELKESHKKGGFGKATAAAGTDKRVEGKINYNRFNQKNQFSIIGLGSNTNQGGMNWDDYQDFKGSQSFNWGDDGDFGFGGGIRYISFGDDDESLTIQAGSGAQNRGYNKNYAAGANYNFDTKKTKLNTSYYFNQSNKDLDAIARQTSFLGDNSAYTRLDTNARVNYNQNHRGSFRLEKELDSLNSFILLSNVRVGNGTADYLSHQEYFRGENLTDERSTVTDIKNYSNFNSFAIANTGIYRHKFKKKGRNFSASVGYNVNNSNGDVEQMSRNQFFKSSPTQPDSIVNIHQTNATKSLRSQVKSSLLYLEPLSKKFVLETFYNFSVKNDKVDRDVFNITEEGQTRNNNLSRYYTNQTDYNRFGTSLRYTNNGFNVSAGLAAQQIHMNGEFAINQDDPTRTRIDRKFLNWTPNATIMYDMKNNRFMYGGYSVSVQEPNINDLQPIVDNSNPLYIRVGNPNLVPTINHNGYLSYNYFNPASFVQMYFGANYNYYENQVIYSQHVDENLITTTKAENISGGKSFNFYGSYGFPIVKTKSNFNLRLNYSNGKNLTSINGEMNKTTSNGYNVGGRLDYTPGDKLTIYTDANWNINDTKYSISSGQNQKIINTTYGVELNFKMPKEIYFNSRFNYNSYVNDRYGFDQKMPILNLSIYKAVLKSKKGEIRLSAYDVFNQNRGISQSAYQNFVSQEQVRTLARYFMLSFSYNMRGMSHSVRRKGY